MRVTLARSRFALWQHPRSAAQESTGAQAAPGTPAAAPYRPGQLIHACLRRGRGGGSISPMAHMSSFTSGTANTVITTSGANGPGKNNGLLQSAQSSGVNTLQRSNNNKNSASQAFQQTNQVVINLDAAYKALPDKSAWLAYAAALGDTWSACTNCGLERTAQKLFRVVNLNRLALGNPATSVPPVDQRVALAAVFLVNFINFGTGTEFNVGAEAGDGLPDVVLTYVFGDGLTNPFFITPAADINGIYGEGTPQYDFYFGVYTRAGVDPYSLGNTFSELLCVSGPDGQPGNGLSQTIFQTAS